MDHGAHLGPGHVLSDHPETSTGVESTVSAGQDASRVTDGLDHSIDAIGHHLWMFDVVGRRIDHTRRQRLSARRSALRFIGLVGVPHRHRERPAANMHW